MYHLKPDEPTGFGVSHWQHILFFWKFWSMDIFLSPVVLTSLEINYTLQCVGEWKSNIKP